MKNGVLRIINRVTALVGMAMLPFVTLAQAEPDLNYFVAAIGAISDVISSLIPLAVAIALIVFIWSVIKFIANASDADARSAGLRQMAWGIVGLFAIVSVWGIVGLLASMVGIEETTALVLPTIPL